MKKLTIIALAATLLSGTAPLAFAQSDTSTQYDGAVEAEIDTQLDVEVNEAEADSSMEIDANVDRQGQMNANTATSAELGTADIRNVETLLRDIAPGDEVDLVLWSEVAATNGAEANMFETADVNDESFVAYLQSEVETNAVLMAELHAGGFSADNVLNIAASADGTVKLYVDDRV